MKIRLLSLGLLLFDVGVGRAGGTVTARTAKGLAAAAMTQSLLGFLVPRAKPAGSADANNGNGLANLPAANNDNALVANIDNGNGNGLANLPAANNDNAAADLANAADLAAANNDNAADLAAEDPADLAPANANANANVINDEFNRVRARGNDDSLGGDASRQRIQAEVSWSVSFSVLSV